MNPILKLFSLFAEHLLAAAIIPIERLSRGFLFAPMAVRATSGMTGQFAGRTTLNSGTATATVSTTNIKSDSLVFHGFQIATTASSGTGWGIGVSSVVHGVSFAVGYTDGQGRAPGGTIMWEIKRTS
jgi:hypothetical protein